MDPLAKIMLILILSPFIFLAWKLIKYIFFRPIKEIIESTQETKRREAAKIQAMQEAEARRAREEEKARQEKIKAEIELQKFSGDTDAIKRRMTLLDAYIREYEAERDEKKKLALAGKIVALEEKIDRLDISRKRAYYKATKELHEE